MMTKGVPFAPTRRSKADNNHDYFADDNDYYDDQMFAFCTTWGRPTRRSKADNNHDDCDDNDYIKYNI